MKSAHTTIHVSVEKQKLDVTQDGRTIRSFPVSTSRFGLGSEEGSNKTPLGRFKVGEKIGDEMPSGTIFKSRQPVQESDTLPETEDWITSRILWLEGLEEHNANTRDRYIYIHGTNHEASDRNPGQPRLHSHAERRRHGLFTLIEEGTPVLITK